jgi:glycosyltransferase involved in cell wall biosynthesis
MQVPPPSLLIIANCLSSWDGRRTYAEDFTARLGSAGLKVRRASSLVWKPARLTDMVLSALGARGSFDAAIVDVFSGQAFRWAEATTRAIRVMNRPFIIALRGGNLPQFASVHTVRVRRVFESASAVVSPSSYLRDAFCHWRPDITLIPNAIELSAYPSWVRRAARPHLVWLRSFHTMYNPSMAVGVLARLSNFHPEARLTMYGVDKGDGSLQQCERLAAELRVTARVRFAGVIPKTEVGRALSQADIFLNTTNVDNTPVSVIEAMACGLCVVSTNVGGVPHLVRDDVDAVLVKAGDTEAMAEAVLRILAQPDLCRRLSSAAQSSAQEFGWDSILPMWLDLVSKVAGRSLVTEAC